MNRTVALPGWRKEGILFLTALFFSSPESHFPKAPEVPRGMPGLQNYRKHLAMELLWLQQAIASRKNVRMLPLARLLAFCLGEQP